MVPGLRISLILPLLLFGLVSCDPTYTIIAPSKLRPNSDYHISVQLDNTNHSATFDITISGPSSQRFNSVQTKFQVQPYESRIVNLEIGEWSKGNYKLIVDGWIPDDNGRNISWHNETALIFDDKSYSIFVQTDKAVYKPGQVVRFRTIIVNPSLIPNLAGSLDIFIKDPNGNLIKQWKRVFTHRGVVSEEFVLSEQPPLGDWSIVVDIAGIQKQTKTFTVAEYVLPTFSVDVKLPSYATYNKSDVIATVKALYTYGKPVKGHVTLTVQPRIRHAGISFRPLEQYQIRTKLNSDGQADIPVNIVRDLNLKQDFFEREIEFFALVEETLTSRKYNRSATMKIHHKEIKIDLIKTSNTFKPGLKYTMFMKVAFQDDTPVDDDGPPVKLVYGYTWDDAQWNNTILKVPKKGIIQIDIYPPRRQSSSQDIAPGDPVAPQILGLRAFYRDQTYYLDSIMPAQSPSNNYIQITPYRDTGNDDLFKNESPKVGQELNILVNATEPFQNLIYEVMAKGDIVLARNVRSTDGTELQFTIPITHRMTPKARLLVYYIRPDNQEIVADAYNFNVDGTFKTDVSVWANVNETKPSGMVDIEVRTKPAAYVGLLGVDQSVLLLKSGFDITQQDVLDELQTYDSGKVQHEPGFGFWRHPFWTGAVTASEVFDNSGVVILTNALLHNQHFQRLGKRIFYSEGGAGGVIVPRQPKRLESTWRNAAPSIRLDDTILEDQLQPPAFKITHKPERRIVLRKMFPETWIWANVTTGHNGVARYSDTIPDTITSWYISAFAVDSITGLGVAPEPWKINVFRPFFLKLSLPYSIIRGESVSIQVLVFNYQSKPTTAEVIMENPDDEFEFTNAANEIEFSGQQGKQLEREKRKTVTIAPYDGVSVQYLITPKKLGPISIRVRATSSNAGDAVIQKLLVKPEGQTQYFNKAMFVNTGDSADTNSASNSAAGGQRLLVKRNVSVDIAPNAVPGSVKVSVSGISDILGPTVNNLDDLLRMPYGCGEQNMIKLVPNIVVLNYLERVNRMTEPIKTKAKRHIETGYQRELTYRHDTGAFSAFGQSDKVGSTWLTAFVVKTFIQARQHIDLDQSIIDHAIEWLITRQRKDGSFAEYGQVHNKALQGGSAIKPLKPDSGAESEANEGGALSAYVMIAILHESKANRAKYEDALQRAANYVYSRIASTANAYEMAIGTYALHLADSPHKEYAYKKLMQMAKKDENSFQYWTVEMNQDKDDKSERLIASDYVLYPNAVDIEASAYALLTMVHRAEIEQAIPTLRWLISKQNSNGGFASTQDTVIALQALGAIAERISTGTVKLSVQIRHGNSRDQTQQPSQMLYFTTDNALVLQQIQLPDDTEWVEMEAYGYGTAIIQVSFQYNLAVSAEVPAFFLNPQKDKTSTENYLQLSVCTYYKDGNSTNMAVMEVELPSGYNADVDALPAATRAKEVKRIDTANNDATVIVYLDRVTRDELCITVPAHRTHHIANNKPVPVTIYDYYDRTKLSRIFYEPTLVTFCDICPQNEIDCKARCSQPRQATPTFNEPNPFEYSGRYEQFETRPQQLNSAVNNISNVFCLLLSISVAAFLQQLFFER